METRQIKRLYKKIRAFRNVGYDIDDIGLYRNNLNLKYSIRLRYNKKYFHYDEMDIERRSKNRLSLFIKEFEKGLRTTTL